jgi:cholesterol transport system auxiliary component
VPTSFPRAGPTRPIVVGEPSALRILDTDRILVRARPNEVAYVARSQWVDRLPRLVQARLIQGFENAMRTRLVARPGEGLDADATLQTDIRTFEIDATRNVARVELTTRLFNRGRIVGTGMFRGESPAGTEGRAAAEGLDRAFQNVVVQIVGWTGAGGRTIA